MAELVFEIWRDAEDGDQAMNLVHPQNDKVRRATMPGAVCIHRYTAQSIYDAFRQYYAWNEWGAWNDAGIEDKIFNEDDAAAQRAYLDEREPVAIQGEHSRPSTS